MFEAGQLIADRYRLINPIGQGVLGELWRAADRVPDRQVAIRRVAPFEERATRRMLLDADVARAVRDRCVARVHRAGLLDDGRAYVASELLLSESLDDLLSRRGRLTPGAALALVADLARGVAAAHDRHLAHRAISPRTVLLHRDERGAITPKLVDFGRFAVVAPDPAYESPEQLPNETGCGYHSDVWALGVILFRCVTGAIPFRLLSEAFDAERIVREADVPEPIRGVLFSALEPVRARRITAAQLADSAQICAWRVNGGFRDLEKMVRIHASVWLDPSATGAIEHFPTIPALGGGPPPRPTDPPLEMPAEMDEEEESIDELAELPRVSSVPPPAAEPEPAPEPQPSLYVTPIPDEVFIDFRPRRSRGAIVTAVAGATALGIVALGALASSPPHRVRIGDVAIMPLTAAATPVVGPKAFVAPMPTSAAAPTVVPVRAVLTQVNPIEPAARAAKKEPAPEPPKSAPTPPTRSYPVVGVPLWDGPPGQPNPPVDNPYD